MVVAYSDLNFLVPHTLSFRRSQSAHRNLLSLSETGVPSAGFTSSHVAGGSSKTLMSFIGSIGPRHHGVERRCNSMSLVRRHSSRMAFILRKNRMERCISIHVVTHGVWTDGLSDVACNALQHASPLACLMAFYRLDHSHASSPWVQSAQHHASLHFALHPLLNDWVIETNVQLGAIGLLVQRKIRPL